MCTTRPVVALRISFQCLSCMQKTRWIPHLLGIQTSICLAFIELLWIIVLMWRCVCHRAGRMGWTSTHGRMQTTTSTRLLTALAFCSKLKLPFGGVNSPSWCARLFVTLKPPAGDVQSRHWRRSRVSSFSHQWARAADSQCSWRKGAATLTLLTLDNDLLCLPLSAFLNQNARFVLIVAPTAKASGDWASGEMAEDGEEMGQVQEQWEGEYITLMHGRCLSLCDIPDSVRQSSVCGIGLCIDT